MTQRPRNVLLLMTDDMNVALRCYGHPAAYTPNFDRLARLGTRFDQAYCPYPLCGPSRTSVMTGQRPERFPMPNNEVAWRDLAPEIRTLPEIARANGLYSACFGKIFHHGIPKAELEAWNKDHPDRVLAHTFDDSPSWDAIDSDKADVHEVQAHGDEQVIDGALHGGTSLHSMRVQNPEVLPDRHYTDGAIRFLESDRVKQPYFLALGFHKPHVPLFAPEKWWSYYDILDVDSLVPPTWHEPADLPKGTLMRDRHHRGADEEQRRHLYKGYLACTSYLDEQLGQVLDALESSGQMDETLIVMVGDHGYHLGEQGQWDKMMLLDPSLHVPMFIAGPGLPQGQVVTSLVESLDVFPTVCELMAWDARQVSATPSLCPLLKNPTASSDRHCFAWVEAGKRRGWSVRSASHRYGLTSWNGGEPQPYLFDLHADPHESRNIAGQAQVAGIQASLDAELRAQFRTTCQIASC